MDPFEFVNTCRTCGKETNGESERKQIFPSSNVKEVVPDEIVQLLSTLRLEVKEDDGLPQNLCIECVKTFSAIVEFVRECEKVTKEFSDYLKACKTIQLEKEIANRQKIDSNLDNCVAKRSPFDVHSQFEGDYPDDVGATIKEENDGDIMCEYEVLQDAVEIKVEEETLAGDEQNDYYESDDAYMNDVGDKQVIKIERATDLEEYEYNGESDTRDSDVQSDYSWRPNKIEENDSSFGVKPILVTSAKGEENVFTRYMSQILSSPVEKEQQMLVATNENNENIKFQTDSDKLESNTKMNIKIENNNAESKTSTSMSDELEVYIEYDETKYSGSDEDYFPHMESETVKQKKPQKRSSGASKKPKKKSSFDDAQTEKCAFCQKTFLRVSKHIVNCPKKNIEMCKYCLLGFQTAEQLENHTKKMHSDGLPTCQICFCTFDTHKKRARHMDNYHSGKIYKCTICDLVLKNRHTFQKHNYRVHSKVVNRECSICSKVLGTEYLYDRHMKSHTDDKRYECKFCGKRYMHVHHRNNHERSHTGERPYLCDECGDTFKDDFAFKIHVAKHGRIVPKPSYAFTGDYECKICHKKMTKRTQYYNHMQRHRHKDIRYPCDKCLKVYSTKLRLKMHVCVNDDSVVEKSHPYNCEICHKGFALHSSLASHVEKHKEPRPHVCPLCNAGFKRIEHLKTHIDRVHNADRKHECPDCHKKFVSKYEMSAHRKVHSDVKPYKCEHCDKTFKWKNILVKHSVVHTGVKPYGCEVCGERFRAYANLESHLTTHPAEQIKSMEKQLFIDFEESRKEEEQEVMNELIFQLIENDEKSVDVVS